METKRIKTEPLSEENADPAPPTKQGPKETMNQNDLDEAIRKLCVDAGETGISNDLLQVALPQVTAMDRAQAINRLLQKRALEILKNEQGQLVYRYTESNSNAKFKAKSHEEQVVYNTVDKAGNKGITAREVAFKTGLGARQATQILNGLKKQNVIKSVRGPKGGPMSFLLAHLEPSRSITGGALYDGTEVDIELVEVLNKVCYSFLEKKLEKAIKDSSNLTIQRQAANATPTEILDHINAVGVCKIPLTIRDIDDHMKSLTFEGKVQRTLISDDDPDNPNTLYRLIRLKPKSETTESSSAHSGLSSSPCGVCPVSNRCSTREGSERSPVTCEYFTGWFHSQPIPADDEVSMEHLHNLVLSLF